uniref:uncharacterized protein LOC124033761 isoform X2 n=1 Tax=Oncorhynchus gorbuscha TaxID=8017 RepID=UPI001EAEB762|nr:uncharacterized protein LOC124033761 isoform X2 [Oncorhynchus gorbuscha]
MCCFPHQARDSQSAQLDVHGQRISQLQTELQESQLELQRGHSRREQQQRDLQTQTQQAEELHTQLAEVKGRLVQVEGENEALMGYKREQGAESSARVREDTESAQAEQRCVDLEGELTETPPQRPREAWAEEQTQKFQVTVSSLKSQHGCVSQQLQDRSAEVQRLQRSLAELHGTRNGVGERDIRPAGPAGPCQRGAPQRHPQEAGTAAEGRAVW